MYLKAIALTQFKNYTGGTFEFSPSLNFLTGENGSGKTNVLDAIHYLALGKSYFHAVDQLAIQHGTNFFRVAGSFCKGSEDIKLACVYQSAGKKELAINGTVYLKLMDHVGLIPVVIIAPDDHSIIDEGSEERRRFIDNTISQIDHQYLENLVSYNKVLQQRNAALKQFAYRKTFDSTLIDSLNIPLISYGKMIFEKRTYFLKAMVPLIIKYYSIISGRKETVTAVYHSIFQRKDFLEALTASLEKDLQLERTTEGTHRDEFDFSMNDVPVKKFGSQGQKKCFLLALKLAQRELIANENNVTPIVLLDDLLDKLDEKRALRILELVSAADFGQVFITGTKTSLIKDFIATAENDLRCYSINAGMVLNNGRIQIADTFEN
ncbi:MAG: DNA replication and repair protein RecF [Chitinophagales bacterium]|nr:DNA replication and repair protein RecF [Chitinophagales bacterium]